MSSITTVYLVINEIDIVYQSHSPTKALQSEDTKELIGIVIVCSTLNCYFKLLLEKKDKKLLKSIKMEVGIQAAAAGAAALTGTAGAVGAGIEGAAGGAAAISLPPLPFFTVTEAMIVCGFDNNP